jgi:hypothetical protein
MAYFSESNPFDDTLFKMKKGESDKEQPLFKKFVPFVREKFLNKSIHHNTNSQRL